MQAVSGVERRRHNRKRVEVEVLVGRGESPRDGQRVSVHDISLSGMAIRPGTMQLKLEDRLSLCFAQQQERCSPEHVIEATVVHLRGDLVGIRFDSVGIHILQDIHSLLREGRIF